MSSPPIIAVSYHLDVLPLLGAEHVRRWLDGEDIDVNNYEAMCDRAEEVLDLLSTVPEWTPANADTFKAWIDDGKQP